MAGPKYLLALLLASLAATAQQYTISTIAGRGQPLYYTSALTAAINPSGMAVDSAGAVYFSSGNAVYRLDSDGSLTRFAGGYAAGCSGDGGPAVNAQLNGPHGVAVDSAGAVYIGDLYNNRIRKVSPDGTIASLAGAVISDCGPNGALEVHAPLNSPAGLAVDATGALYIAGQDSESVTRVSNGSWTTTAFPSIGAYITGVAADAAGNFYITGNGVRKVTPSGLVSTLVGPDTLTTTPAVDAAGNVYFTAEQGGGTVMKVTPNGVVSPLVGEGSSTYPRGLGLAVDAAGNLYIASQGDYLVRKLSAGGVLSTAAGNGTPSYYGDGGPATDALLSANGIALDAAGSLYLADTDAHRVRKIAADGTISTIAGDGAAPGSGNSGDGGPAASAAVEPWGLAFDSPGNLYIAERSDIRSVGLDGTISTFFQHIQATHLAFGVDDSLYASGTIVNKILPSGAAVPVAGFANPPPTCIGMSFGAYPPSCSPLPPTPLGDGGPATQATILPAGIVVDSASNLYIADLQGRVREVRNSTSIIETIAGGGSSGSLGDGGPATYAQLKVPGSVAFDTAGNLYIADTGYHRIRKVSANGVIITIAGNGAQGHSGDGGPALDAQLAGPVSLAVDAAGDIYVSDADSIRLLTPVTGCARRVEGVQNHFSQSRKVRKEDRAVTDP